MRSDTVHLASVSKVTSPHRIPGNNWVVHQSWVDATTRAYGGSTWRYFSTWRKAIDFAFAHACEEVES